MNKPNLTNCQLLRELKEKLTTNQIGFWIENQDCYLWENTFHYTNKIKVGDLAMTKEAWWVNWTENLMKYYQESEIKSKLREKQFQNISDLDIIEELSKRIKKNAIKLSMYPNQDHISMEGKDIDKSGGKCLPIEIKEKDHE